MSEDGAIPAATIILMREAPAFEVLMIERHADIAFAGGALVFPGGRIDPGDRADGWAGHCAGYADTPEHERAARIAAIREAFEETGILFAREVGAANGYVDGARTRALSPWRARIEADGGAFLDFVREERLVIDLGAPHLFAHWVPPMRLHRRFDTLFFAARAPEGQKPIEDGNEATEAMWIEPGRALEAREAGTRKMIFPTMCNVALLAANGGVDAVFASAAARLIEPVMPKIIERGEHKILTIPDHYGYPVIEEPLEASFKS